MNKVKELEKVKIEVVEQFGSPVLYDKPYGYILYKNEDVLCFYVDVKERAWVSVSCSDENYPWVSIDNGEQLDDPVTIAFLELKDWEYFCSSGGKTISFTFVHKRVKDKFYGRVA